MRLAPSLGGIDTCLWNNATSPELRRYRYLFGETDKRCTLAAPSKLSMQENKAQNTHMQETLHSTGKEAFRGQ